MSNILQTWCQIQCTAHSLRYVTCGPRHIQCNYSTAYSGFNIQLNVSPLLLQISRQFNERCFANVVPNTPHVLQFTLFELRSRTYAIEIQLRIFRLQYSAERITAGIGDVPTCRCALNFKFGAKYRAHLPIYSMWTVVPDICNIFTAPDLKASIFNWTCLRCYWRYLDNSLRVIQQTLCQIRRTSSNLRYVNCCPGHMQYIYSSGY
jgi:hypothetical protein